MWAQNDEEAAVHSTDQKAADGALKSNKRSLNFSKPETDEVLVQTLDIENEKRSKSGTSCQVHQVYCKKADGLVHDAIRRWQMCTFTKCIYENAVNTVLDSFPSSSDSYQRNALTALSHNLNLENEAVLMAIQWKGLKQHNSVCSCPHEDKVEERASCTSSGSEEVSNYLCRSDLQRGSCKQESGTNILTLDCENLESNFDENNFITTAVSAAIEEKGLTIYRL